MLHRAAVRRNPVAGLLLGSLLLLTTSCDKVMELMNRSQYVNVTLAQTPAACTRNVASVDTAFHQIDSAKVAMFVRNRLCTFDVFEYNDEQALIWGNNHDTYGPVAHAYAYDYGRGFKDPTVFNAGWVLLGIIDVDAGNIPGVYKGRLNLTNGLNCIYARHSGSDPATGWETAIGGPTSGVCTSGGSAKIVGKYAEQPSTNPDDYPVSARFMEAPNSQPSLGIRCGNAWCVAGAKDGNDITPPAFNGLSGVGSTSRWTVKGWFDDQTLGKKTPPSGPLAPFVRLAVVPNDNLGSYNTTTFLTDWTDVATILVPSGVDLGKYGTTGKGGFALVPGENVISIKAVNISGVLNWISRVRNTTYQAGSEHVYKQAVHREDHSGLGILIDGTARWKWLANDEAVWVRCDLGCCLVYGDE